MAAVSETELIAALKEIAADDWHGYGGFAGGLGARGRAQLALARTGHGYEQYRALHEGLYALERGLCRVADPQS